MTPVLTSATELRHSGRNITVPFSITLETGKEIHVLRLLRVLPGKRIVGEGLFNNKSVLVKLFVSPSGCERHYQRERGGVMALQAAGLATPEIIDCGMLSKGGYVLLYRYLTGAENLADAWTHAVTEQEQLDVLSMALTAVARMHRAGLMHVDLHLGNFLRHMGILYFIDGDAVNPVSPGKPLDAADASRNLAVLFAQIPTSWDQRRDLALEIYGRQNSIVPDTAMLAEETRKIRRMRLQDILDKSVRDCTLFAVEHDKKRFCSVLREYQPLLAPLLEHPDKTMARGEMLKAGGTSTVVRVHHDPLDVVVKRYNIKSLRHGLSRFWRHTRAWHAWHEGIRLRFMGIATPRPLALLERRYGPLRFRAWLVTEYCTGPCLLEHLNPDMPPPQAEAQAIITLFTTLCREYISHGDLKASNLIWHQNQVLLLDLDATCQHKSPARFAKAWRRDRNRLLRNWVPQSALHQWLDANLPPVISAG